MTYLRPIALTVEERRPGAFDWLLIENTRADAPEQAVVAASEEPLATYAAALHEAVEALESLADGHPGGPRVNYQAMSWA